MRLLLAFCFIFSCAPAWSGVLDDIQDTFRSLQKVISTVSALDSKRAAQLHADFQELQQAAGVTDVKLVVTTDLLGQSFPDRLIAIGLEIADLPRSQRMFVLAHELSHVANNDFEHFFKWAQHADQALAFVAPELEAEANARVTHTLKKLSHQKEFAADQYASHMLVRLGLDPLEGAQVLTKVGSRSESVTHPATDARLLKLKNSSF